MIIFLQNLITCSVIMSVISILFIVFTRIFGSRYSAKQRYYSFLVILLGFLTPIKIKIFNSPVCVNTNVYYEPKQILPSFTLWNAVFFVWLIGFAVCIVYEIIKHARFMSAVDRFSNITENSEIISVSKKILTEKNIKRKVSLRVFPLIASPMIVGVLEPVLLLPCKSYSRRELELILAHEYTHLKRCDGIYKALIIIFKAMHWFNPFTALISSTIERECEISCDEEVVKDLTKEEKKFYCNIILEAVNISSQEVTSFSTNFCLGGKALKRRLEEIISSKSKHRIMIIGIIVLCLTFISGTFISFGIVDNRDDRIFETTVTSMSFSEKPNGLVDTTVQPTTTTFTNSEYF